MENDRFDEFTKHLARTTSRRQVLRTVAGGALGGLLAMTGRDHASAFICRAGGVLCSEDAQCCSSICDQTTHQCACADGQLLCRDRCIPACAAVDACHVAGSCDPSTGQCTNPPAQAGTACGAASACANGMAIGQSTCDGAGHCTPGTATQCAPYVCGATACLTSCTSTADCASNHFCNDGACTSVAPNGTSCTSAGQCQSGICVDGVCCDTACTGQCQACDISGSLGTCTAVTGAPHGNRAACTSDGSSCAGSCDGSNTQGCSYPGSSTSCRQASCADGSETLAASCNGQGACSAVQTKSCAPYACGGASCLTGCTSTADCANGNYCSGGSCIALQANGTTCTSGDQCTSGHCVDGYCCDAVCTDQCAACNVSGNLGTCTAVTGTPVGGRAACAGAGATCGGSCDGMNTQSCTYPGASTNCRAASCTNGTETLAASCDGAGACPAAQTQSCGAYLCGTDACLTNCTGDTQCVSTGYCDTSTTPGACKQDLANGQACSRDHQCTSGNCVDGFCCNAACAGQCEACDVTGSVGTCTAVSGAPHSSRIACTSDGTVCGGTCDGTTTQSCTYPPSTTTCGTGPICTNDTAKVQDMCNGAGMCTPGTSTSCAPYACGSTSCLTSCAADSDCASGDRCSGGKCVAQLANGTTCTAADQCLSGNCVDGHCCNTPCYGQCEACDVIDALGTCTLVTGKPHGTRPACTTDGTACGGLCDGNTQICFYAGQTVICGTGPTCTNDTATAADTCDGAGHCVPGATTNCAPYACGATACIMYCNSDKDCASGNFCLEGICTAQFANGHYCASADYCLSGSCCGDCVDLSSDLKNCGSCGNVCHGGNDCNAASCSQGKCLLSQTNEGGSCHGGQGTCQSGTCVVSSTSAFYCAAGQPDCNNFQCFCNTDVDGSEVCQGNGGACTFSSTPGSPMACASDGDCANFGYPGYACVQATAECYSGTACAPYCS